jgi:hypothetical protein
MRNVTRPSFSICGETTGGCLPSIRIGEVPADDGAVEAGGA